MTIKTSFLNPRLWLAVSCAILLSSGSAHAATYPLPPEGSDLIGQIIRVRARHNDTLLEIGRHYGVGFNEMQNANPGIDMWVPEEGTLITVPTQFILPPGPRDGVVVNLPEMRIYYYLPHAHNEQPQVATFPVSIGRMDWSTPLGTTKVTVKAKNPAWYPPQSVREEHARDGDPLPAVVPAGPDNPLGNHAIRLGIPGYLIHGTNRPMGVGMRVTHGCIRMFPEDVEYLFDILPVGTTVRLINQPFKAGWHAGLLYFEAHPLLEDEIEKNTLANYVSEVSVLAQATEQRPEHFNSKKLKQIIEHKKGYPEVLSHEK